MPKVWYNINADMPVPSQPVLHLGTMQPVTPDFLSVLFPMNLILREVSAERWIEIPEPVRDVYKLLGAQRRQTAHGHHAALDRRARPSVNIPLERLASGETLESKNVWLQNWLREKIHARKVRFY